MLLHVHRGQSGPNFQIFQRWHRDHRRWSLQIDQRWRKQQYDNVDHRKSKSHRRGRVPSLHRKLSRVRRKEFHALCIRYVIHFIIIYNNSSKNNFNYPTYEKFIEVNVKFLNFSDIN